MDNKNTGENFVQIHANRDEMVRRIAAFCARKREQIDERKVSTFCGHKQATSPEYNSCARVDAVLFPTYGKSRFKVSSVHNKEGPQLEMGAHTESPQVVKDTHVGANIEGRLRDLESHCSLSGRTDLSMVERVKTLEDRVLYLEGVSPEYFNHSERISKPARQSADYLQLPEGNQESQSNDNIPIDKDVPEELSLIQINERIAILKRNLRAKALEYG